MMIGAKITQKPKEVGDLLTEIAAIREQVVKHVRPNKHSPHHPETDRAIAHLVDLVHRVEKENPNVFAEIRDAALEVFRLAPPRFSESEPRPKP